MHVGSDKNIIKFGRKKKIFFNLIILFIFIFLFLAGIFSLNLENKMTEIIDIRRSIIEEQWREQARSTLNALKIEFLHEVEDGDVNPYHELDVEKWAITHLQPIRNGGPTSDGFIIDMSNEKLLLNDSPDMNRNQKQYIYLDQTIELFKDPTSAERVYNEMRKLYSTTSVSKNQWNFDGSEEFLEWVMIPTDGLGFDSEPFMLEGIKNRGFKGYLIVLGTQKDEIFSPFFDLEKSQKIIKSYLLVFDLVLFMISIFFIIWFIYKESFSG